MDTALRTSIILAAVGAAGPADSEDWAAKVSDLAGQITVMTSDQSAVAKRIEAVASAKVFRGAVIGVAKEQSSTRGVVTLKTGTNRDNKDAITKAALPAGHEQVRTERTDDPIGLAMARRMKSLIGHDVLVWVFVEEINGGQTKVRVLVHVEDLGVSKDPDAVAAAAELASRAA